MGTETVFTAKLLSLRPPSPLLLTHGLLAHSHLAELRRGVWLLAWRCCWLDQASEATLQGGGPWLLGGFLLSASLASCLLGP